MAILLYQIGIFIAIQIAAMFGKNSRNTAIVLISIFTILQVFMSWLLLLQFITIYVSYNISNNLFFSDSPNKPVVKPQKEIRKSTNEKYSTKEEGDKLETENLNRFMRNRLIKTEATKNELNTRSIEEIDIEEIFREAAEPESSDPTSIYYSPKAKIKP